MTQALQGKTQSYKKGETLIRENEISRKMFVLRTGKVRVYKSYMGQKITMAILSEGEIFGELSFFDGQPRSASVEAISPVECYIIDSSEAQEQFNGLPEWFQPIIKTVFNRLRLTDTRATILQSMNEVEKRHFKRDSVAQGLYAELLRFNKVLTLIYDRNDAAKKTTLANGMLEELDDLLGDRTLNLQSYWKLLKEYDFIDRDVESQTSEVRLRRSNIDEWIKELKTQIETEKFTLISHSALAILKRILSLMTTEVGSSSAQKKLTFNSRESGLDSMPLYDEALDELARLGFVSTNKGTQVFEVDPQIVFRTYTYQSLLKYFDHTVHNI